MSRPGVKICGITRVEDARMAVDLGAELLGLNFWPRSPRFLELAAAEPIVRAVAGQARLVGVWVDPRRDEVERTATELGLDLLQIHGDGGEVGVDDFPGRVIRALQVGPQSGLPDLGPLAAAWGFLFDCAPTGLYGGTGISWAYERIADLESDQPVLLAGGLRPSNVAAACRASGADFADVCSGVESAPGIKDPHLLERFIREVHNAQTED